jgi:hypothetical protein
VRTCVFLVLLKRAIACTYNALRGRLAGQYVRISTSAHLSLITALGVWSQTDSPVLSVAASGNLCVVYRL